MALGIRAAALHNLEEAAKDVAKWQEEIADVYSKYTRALDRRDRGEISLTKLEQFRELHDRTVRARDNSIGYLCVAVQILADTDAVLAKYTKRSKAKASPVETMAEAAARRADAAEQAKRDADGQALANYTIGTVPGGASQAKGPKRAPGGGPDSRLCIATRGDVNTPMDKWEHCDRKAGHKGHHSTKGNTWGPLGSEVK